MNKKLFSIVIVIALVAGFLGGLFAKPSLKSGFGGTVENFPVLFQNGLQTGVNPVATATDSLIRVANRIASGNSSGTYLGINANSGYGGDLANLQVNGTSEFKIDASGNVTANGTLAPGATSNLLVTAGQGLDTVAAGALKIGPTTATSVVLGGTAVTALTTTGTTASTITLGTATQTGTITIGQSTAGETLSLLNTVNTVADTINIASGAAGAATTVNILTGVSTSGTQAVNIASGAAASTVTIGNVTGASGTAISVGTGNFSITGAAGSTLTLGTGLTTGTTVIGNSAQTGAITLGNYSGGSASTINIGTGATTAAEAINIGNSATGAGSANIEIGSPVTTAGNGTEIQGVLSQFHPTTAVSVSSSTVITASQLLNAGIILHPSADNNPRTFTLDSGTNIAAAMPGGSAAAGDTFSFEVANGINTVTLAADAGSSFFTGATLTVAVGVTRIVNCQFTSSSVYICY